MFCFAKCCRFCLKKSHKLFDFNLKDNEATYYEKVTEIVPSLEWFSSDKFPKLICASCIEKLNIAFEFRQTCLKSQKLFFAYLNQLTTASNCTISDENNHYDLNISIVDVLKVKTKIEKPENNIIITSNSISYPANSKVKKAPRKPPEIIVYNKNNSFDHQIQLVNKDFCNTIFVESESTNMNKFIQTDSNSIIYTCESRNNTLVNIIEPEKSESNSTSNSHTFQQENTSKTIHQQNDNNLVQTNMDFSNSKQQENVCLNGNLQQNEQTCTDTSKHNGRVCNPISTNNCPSSPTPFPKVSSYVCNTCNKSFPLLESLQIHARTHLYQSFACTICLRAFNNYYELKCHEQIHVVEKRVHGEAKRFVCNTCNRGFVTVSLLKKHEASHIDDRPYSCKTCAKTFVYSYDLKRHEKSHVIHTCKTCKETFSSHAKLKIHEYLHVGVKRD